MSDALLPCPFCGTEGKPELSHETIGTRVEYAILCNECDVSTCLYPAKRTAIAAWNRRANPVLDELRAAVRECFTLLDAYEAEAQHAAESGEPFDVVDETNMGAAIDEAFDRLRALVAEG